MTKSTNEEIFIFSYGTLLDKYKKFIDGILIGPYIIDHTDIFPRIVSHEDEHEIFGSVIKVSQEEFMKIDIYEDFPTLYNRKEIPIYTKNGYIYAWVYL